MPAQLAALRAVGHEVGRPAMQGRCNAIHNMQPHVGVAVFDIAQTAKRNARILRQLHLAQSAPQTRSADLETKRFPQGHA